MAFLGTFVYSQLFVTPEYPTKSFAGQTVIVTGSNTGLGLEFARNFVQLNAEKVILAVRKLAAGEEAKISIRINKQESCMRSLGIRSYLLSLCLGVRKASIVQAFQD